MSGIQRAHAVLLKHQAHSRALAGRVIQKPVAAKPHEHVPMEELLRRIGALKRAPKFKDGNRLGNQKRKRMAT
jgi:hypothetical protein